MAKIMTVDDNKDIVETLKMIIAKEGHECEFAYNGEEFLSKVDKFQPNIVLLDVMMPGLTTRQILEKLKEKNLKDLKVILVTVVRFSDAERNALFNEFQVVDYVGKPFDISELVDSINKNL